MVVGGIYTLWSMRKTIITGLKKSFVQSESDADLHLRTEKDLPLQWVAIACGVLVVLTFFFYWLITGSLILSLAGALFLALVAFFFAAVAGYIAGVVGSSNSPVSGMTIATLLFTVGLVWIVGSLFLGLEQTELMYATLLMSPSSQAVRYCRRCHAGSQDRSHGWRNAVSTTDRRDCGRYYWRFVIGPTIALLHKAFQISSTACIATNERISAGTQDPIDTPSGLYDCNDALFAPQAELIGAIVKGAFVGDMNLPMVFMGAHLRLY